SGAATAVVLAPLSVSSVASSLALASTASVAKSDLSFDSVKFIQNQKADTLAVRWVGTAAGWGGVAVLNPAEKAQQKKSWSVGVEAGTQVKTLDWAGGARPQPQALLDAIYQPRLTATNLVDLIWRPIDITGTTLWLTHLYSFVIPQALGDCYAAFGNYARAEQYYLQAAQYTYVNVALEGTALWMRMARNI